MTLRLKDVSAAEVSAGIAFERRRVGASASGSVLTLVIVTDAAGVQGAVEAAEETARVHPMRILALVPVAPDARARGRSSASRLDAEVSTGGDGGPGESAILYVSGSLIRHAESVVVPLLLPDTPVVAWWPGAAPRTPAADPIGALATRRITDAAASRQPVRTLATRHTGYQAGDTDLAWTRVTPWRSCMAAVLDEPLDRVSAAYVEVEASNPSGPLLAAWLHQRLRSPVVLRTTQGPGITGLGVITKHAEVIVNRPDGRRARLTRTDQPVRTIALPRRKVGELLAEELRRLEPDPVYANALRAAAERSYG